VVVVVVVVVVCQLTTCIICTYFNLFNYLYFTFAKHHSRSLTNALFIHHITVILAATLFISNHFLLGNYILHFLLSRQLNNVCLMSSLPKHN